MILQPKKLRTYLPDFYLLVTIFLILWYPANAQQHVDSDSKNIERIFADGIKLAISCKGQGSPAVVIEPGSGDPGYSWVNVQDNVAKFTKVCWYSRPGLGESDSLKYSQTPSEVVERLHTLLRNASVDPPYILVGHSIGGLHVRKYHKIYPKEVVAMVLVDSSHEDQWAILSGFMSEEYMSLYKIITKSRNWDEKNYGTQLDSLGTVRDLPLVVLTGAKIDKFEDGLLPPAKYLPAEYQQQAEKVRPEVKRKAAGYKILWLHLQEDLAGLSTNSRHFILKDSGHAIHVDKPKKLTEAIKRVFEEVSK